jgi:hypothetical protein
MLGLRVLIRPVWGLLLIATAFGHPGDGIVADGQGDVFYSDLAQVWQLRDGADPTVVIAHVHSHQLHWSSDGRLVGEDVRHVADGHFKRRLWSWQPDQSVQFGDWREGHPWDVGDYGIPRDRQGRQYLIRGLRLEVIQSDGERLSVALPAASPGWLAFDHRGRVLFTAGDALMRWAPGQQAAEVLATSLIEWRASRRMVDERHALLGLCTRGESTLVAVNSARTLKHVHEGVVREVYRAPLNWSPSGCTFDAEGRLWVLEYSLRGKVRARVISAEPHDFTPKDQMPSP